MCMARSKTIIIRIWTCSLVAATVVGLSLWASGCNNDPKYYKFEPNGNTNEWPYRVPYCHSDCNPDIYY